jgi:hypothetical protein
LEIKGDIMRYIAYGVGVDAGMIILGDLDYSKEVNKFGFSIPELKKLGQIFNVPTNGKYEVKWKLFFEEDEKEKYESLEDINGSGIINVTSGKIFIVDPCYVIGTKGGKWGDWLNATDYGNAINSDKAFLLEGIHDDGCYNIEFYMKLIEIQVEDK